MAFAVQEIPQGIWNGEELQTSLLGMPLLHPIKFIGISQEVQELFLPAVTYDISMSKNIVKTSVQGRRGTIKEFISDGDYVLNLSGVLANESITEYPYELVNKLRAICEAEISIPVYSKLLDLFGITEIVIERFDFKMKAGAASSQEFTINAISDKPLELRIRDGE